MVLELDFYFSFMDGGPRRDSKTKSLSFARSYLLDQRIVVLFILSRVGGIKFQQNDTAPSEMFICSARGGFFAGAGAFADAQYQRIRCYA